MGPGDLEFLFRTYASSREREMALVTHWSEGEKEGFLRQQFELQHRHYQTYYSGARYDVIVEDGKPIGRLYVARLRREIRLMDITLLPEHRNRGIGGALVRQIQDEAARAGVFVSLHVEDDNPAKRLYERLGFTEAGEVSFYKLMRWMPPGVARAPTKGA